EQGQNVHIDEQTLNKRLGKQDIAILMCTSGSTGTPKGETEFDKVNSCDEIIHLFLCAFIESFIYGKLIRSL
ncbi:unnamed protein product, partial [Rotaria sordida]